MRPEEQAKSRDEKAGAGWFDGCDSLRMPWLLKDSQFRWGINVVNRGGVLQTRYGHKLIYVVPDGNFQGYTTFTTSKDGIKATTYHIFSVNGIVYAIAFGTAQPKNWDAYRLNGVFFKPTAKMVYWAACEKSAGQAQGAVTIVPTYSVLVMQDGIGPAGYWDGETAALLDETEPAYETPTGTWMKWSGSRLWIARENAVLASDLADPLTFKERLTGTGRGDEKYDNFITGLENGTTENRQSALMVFTESSTHTIKSYILDRETWDTTTDFSSLVYPDIGCVAGRSIVNHSGFLWWYSRGGLIGYDSASANFLTSAVKYRDTAMAISRAKLADNIDGICAASFEGYLLISVPSGDGLNNHTMVLDSSPSYSDTDKEGIMAWNGVWTGTRPIQWTSARIDGRLHIFHASIGYQATEGTQSFNQIWESFQPERRDVYFEVDDGGEVQEKRSRIYCAVETKQHGDGMDLKQIKYADIDLCELKNDVYFRASYASTQGTYKKIMEVEINAQVDNFNSTNPLLDEIVGLTGLRPQSRRLSTEEVKDIDRDFSVETNWNSSIGRAFSMLFEWCGEGAIEVYRMMLQPWNEKSVGSIVKPEDSYNLLTEAGKSLRIPRVGAKYTKSPTAPAVVDSSYSAYAFAMPLTPKFRERFYSSIPVAWTEDTNCSDCLPCSRNTQSYESQPTISIAGKKEAL